MVNSRYCLFCCVLSAVFRKFVPKGKQNILSVQGKKFHIAAFHLPIPAYRYRCTVRA